LDDFDDELFKERLRERKKKKAEESGGLGKSDDLGLGGLGGGLGGLGGGLGGGLDDDDDGH